MKRKRLTCGMAGWLWKTRFLAMALTLMATGGQMAMAQDGLSRQDGQDGKLQGRIALVTGAGSGMGREIARLFAREGAIVLAADIDGDAAEKTAQTIRDGKGQALAVTADVTQETDVARMVDTAVSTYGRLDIVINNAGIFDMLVPAGEVTDALWDQSDRAHARHPQGVACIRKTERRRDRQYGIHRRPDRCTRGRCGVCRVQVWTDRSDQKRGVQLQGQKHPLQCRGAGTCENRHPRQQRKARRSANPA